jgi:protein-disulfide isomerase
VTLGEPKPEAGAAKVAVPRRWLGLLAVVFGCVLMVGGIVGVWIYARHLPTAALPRTSSPVPAPIGPAPTPVPPPLALPAPATSVPVPGEPGAAGAPERPTLSLPVALAPFAEDAAAPVPVVGGHPLWGGRDAFVTVTLFGDLECPHTVALLHELFRVKAQKGDELRLAFRHLPLSQHSEGQLAARALAEIHATRGEQAFWHALAGIVRRGEPLAPGGLAGVLDDAGLPGFPLPSPNARAEAALAEDAELATLLFVRDTPTLFVNGRRLAGYVGETALGEAVERERRVAYLALAAGTPPAIVYGERTRKNLLNLGADPPTRTCVPSSDAPVSGPAAALVTVVEFSDLECELCRQGDTALAAVLRAHPGDVKVVWRNFPLPQHHRARLAAGVALSARKLGGDAAFWAVTRALLEPRGTLDDDALVRAAGRAGLDATKILEAARGGANDASIDRDVKLAERLGISGAPTYFVNGQKIPGALPEGELRALVERELMLARRVRSQGAGLVGELACGVRKRARSAPGNER